MDVREFGFWVEEATRTEAIRQLSAVSAASAPHMTESDRKTMIRNLQKLARTPEELEARRAADLAALRATGASRARRKKRSKP